MKQSISRTPKPIRILTVFLLILSLTFSNVISNVSLVASTKASSEEVSLSDSYDTVSVDSANDTAVSSADKSNELSVTLLDNVNITPVVEDVTQTPQNVASTLSATVFSTSPATLKIYQGRKNSQCDRYGTTVVTDSQGNVVATKTGNSTTTYSGALGDFQINDETGAVTPMEEVFTVTVTAPEGYYIASVTSTTASALTAKDDYDFSDPVQEYTLTGFTSDQTVYVTYSASTLTLKNHKSGDTLASFYSAGVTFDVSEGAINNSSSWTKASNSTGQIVSTYIASINEGSKFSTLTLDTSGISCEYALTDIQITKDGKAWDILDTSSLPLEDNGTVVLNFKDNAVVAADSAASDIVVNLYYTPQNSIITIEHDHAGLSTSNYNRADVKLTVSEGTTQAKNSAISVPYNSATPSFTVKTGSVLSSLSLSGYVFNDASGLGVSDITVYKNDVEWDVIDDSAITYPIIDPATIPFKSSTIMPEDNIRVVLSYAPVNGKFEVVQQNGAGTVATTSASRVFINSLGSSSLQTVNNVSSASNTAYLFDSEGNGITFSSIKVTAPNFRYFESIKLYVDGVDKSSYIVQPDPGVSTFSLADGFSIAQNSDVKLVVTYKSWNTISVINHYDDSVTSPPDRYARCTVYSASGAFSYNNGGPYNSFTATADNVSTSVLLKPDVTLSRIIIDPQPYHSVSEVYVTVNGVRKDGILLTDGLIPSTGSITVYFADNTSFSIDEKVEIHVVCDDWDFFKLTQKYVDSYENHPSYYGSVTAYSSSGAFVYGSGGPYNSVSLTGNETSKEVIIKPGADLSRIVVNVPQNQTVSNAYVLVNGEKKDNVLDTSALPTTNNPTLYFADDFIVSAKDNIEVVVEYSGWGSIGLNHKYVDSYQNPPATLGSYILYSEGGAFVYGSGGPYSNISLTGNETHREAILKPDSVLTRIHINPPENHTIADAYITVNGVRVDDALDTSALPTTNSITLYFKDNYSIPASDHVEIFVEYSGWGSIGLNHKYVDSYQNPPATLGSYVLYSTGGAFVYGNGGPYGNISLTGTETHREATLKPDAVLDRISVSPPENHTIADAYITVNGVRVDDAIDTSALPTTNSITLYFKDNYSIPASDHVEVFVEYSGWGKFAIHHKYADSYQNPPATLGSYVLYSTGGAFVYGNGGPYGNISLTGNESSRECILKPDSELNRISISPPENHSIVDAYVTVNGTVDEDALIWPDPVPTSGGMTLYFTEDYIIKADDFVEVFVVYGGWNEMSIHHRFADSVENPPAALGSYVLYSTGGAFVYGNGGPYGNISLTGNQTSRDTILKPDAELDRISISPPENHSIVDAYVTVNGTVDEDALIWPTPFPTSGHMTLYFTEDYIVSTDDKVEVHVVYGEWNEMSIHHKFADSVKNPPAALGSYVLYSTGGAFVYGNGGPYGNISLTGNQTSKDTILKPDAELDRISISPPSYYSVVDAYVTVNGEVDEDALIWPTPFPTSGHMTLYFTEDYIVSTDDKVEVHVVYGEWNEFIIEQKYADSVDNPPSTYGSVISYSNGGAFVYGNGGPYGNISLSGNQASREAFLKPDAELDRISVTPPANHSIVDIYVLVNGVEDEDALIWPTPFPTSGYMTLYFTDNYIVPTDNDIKICIEYGDWNKITVNQTNLVGSKLGSIKLSSDRRSSFIVGNSRYTTYTVNTASHESVIHPDALVNGLVITPPSGLTIISATATITDKNGNTSVWKTNGSDVLTLNDDGTVTFTAAKPTGDVTIDVKYGAKLYVKTNNEGSAAIDGKDIPTAFTFIRNITSGELTLAPAAKSGWKIESVLYGTSNSMQPTEITAENGEYKISDINSDVYVYVKTVPEEKNITARQDGPGKVTLTYDGNDTVLSGTAADIGTAAIGNTVSFALAADAGTKITDITVNGTSIGTAASFTMPDTDAEIVVYTDVELPDTLWLAARKIGSGTAQAVYGDTTVTLESNARILATRLESGKYTIEVMPTEGSRIVSVSMEGTELETAVAGAYVYHLDLVDDNVTVTVEAVKDSNFVVYAKVNVDGKASVNGAALSTDYKSIAETASNGTVTAELSLESGYVLTGARCGSDKSALTAVEFTDGKYEISNITSDMYLDISVARKPVITVNRTGNGSIYTNSGSTDVSNTRYEVTPGSDHTFEFMADSGSTLVSVTVKRGNGEAETVYPKSTRGIMTLAAADFEYALSDVNEDCEITAVFSQVTQSYTLHVVKTGNGSGKFTLDSDEYTDSFAVVLPENTAPVLGITAGAGSKIASVKIGDSTDTAAETTLSNGTLSIPAMTKDVYVIVEINTVGTPNTPGGTPDTGDDNGSTAALIIMISSLAVLALIAGALFIRRRKCSEK